MTEEAWRDGMDWFPLVFEVPLIQLLGARPVDPRDPNEGLSFVVTEQVLNAAGALHGGAISTALDLAAYLSVLPTLAPGEQAVTHAMAATYLSRTEMGETLVAKGRLLRRTRRLAFITSELASGDRLVAAASVTKSILAPG